MLQKASSSPDIINYLIDILRSDAPRLHLSASDTFTARSAAALKLKNLVKTNYKQLNPEVIAYVRATIIPCVGDDSLQVRNSVGLVISELVKQGGVMSWPQVYSELFDKAQNSESPKAREGAARAVLNICEDNIKQLLRMPGGQRPVEELLPRLYGLMENSNPVVRAIALECVNFFMEYRPQSILNTVDTLLRLVFRLATDTSDDVRRHVCRTLSHLVEMKPESILPHLDGLVDYLITQQRNGLEPDLALEAAEFWLTIAEHRQKLAGSLGPYLEKIVPTLLECMVYSEDDIARLEGDRDDADQEDREQDIKPNFATSKRGKLLVPNSTNGSNGASGTHTPADLSDGEIEEDDEDGGDGDPEDEWNLRKCSAAALDLLANSFPERIFHISLPYLKNNLQNPEWPMREAAVLAFGALADGCEAVVSPYLPELIPFLITLLQDKEPVVRKITCWALGRYVRWVVHLEKTHPQLMSQYLETIIENLLKSMHDRNKAVQEGAASAFSTLVETAGRRLEPYVLVIVQQFDKCFETYKDRNMLILYDCVQTLAERIGPKLASPDIESVLMTALTKRWQKVSDQSKELFPLLECLSYVASAMKEAFEPYSQVIFNRCISVVHSTIEEEVAAARNPRFDSPGSDCLVTSLDLLSSMVQVLSVAKSSELVANSQPKLFDLLRFCVQSDSMDVRQSGYALLGDCAVNLFPQLQPELSGFIPMLVTQLDINNMRDQDAEAAFAVVNNACWSCGEIAIQQGSDILGQYIDKIYRRVFDIISNPDIPVAVQENAAIALGRLGNKFSEHLAPQLAEWAPWFTQLMTTVDTNTEKCEAYNGFSMVIKRNPAALGADLIEYLKTIAQLVGSDVWQSGMGPLVEEVCVSSRLKLRYSTIGQIITTYKKGVPNFHEFFAQVPVKERQLLVGKFPNIFN